MFQFNWHFRTSAVLTCYVSWVVESKQRKWMPRPDRTIDWEVSRTSYVSSHCMHIHNAKWMNGNYAFPYSIRWTKEAEKNGSSSSRTIAFSMHLRVCNNNNIRRTHVNRIFFVVISLNRAQSPEQQQQLQERRKKYRPETWLCYVFNLGPWKHESHIHKIQ